MKKEQKKKAQQFIQDWLNALGMHALPKRLKRGSVEWAKATAVITLARQCFFHETDISTAVGRSRPVVYAIIDWTKRHGQGKENEYLQNLKAMFGEPNQIRTQLESGENAVCPPEIWDAYQTKVSKMSFWLMPGIDRFQLVEKIKENETGR